MFDKFTIINLLNKLATEQRLTWRIKSAHANGKDNSLLEILIYTLPDQRRKGQIMFHANSGAVTKVQYTGYATAPAEDIVDMLLDIINHEKCMNQRPKASMQMRSPMHI